MDAVNWLRVIQRGPTPNRQTRKRLATRQRISDVATRLFFERGFDQVKVDEIADAADVSRMTIFNHFPRKEDMFFDLDKGARADLLAALHQRKPGISPIEALRLLAHEAVAEGRPYVRFFDQGSDRFMETIQASEALKARARAIRDELAEILAASLAATVNRHLPDPSASLAAGLVIATWTVALLEARRVFQQGRGVEQANTAFLALVDQGMKGVRSALEGTPFS